MVPCYVTRGALPTPSGQQLTLRTGKYDLHVSCRHECTATAPRATRISVRMGAVTQQPLTLMVSASASLVTSPMLVAVNANDDGARNAVATSAAAYETMTLDD